jgi:hypothetical protein
MKHLFIALILCTLAFAVQAQTADVVTTQGTEQAINWQDMAAEALIIVLSILAFLGRFILKGKALDVLEWTKKAIGFILDLLPAREKDGTFNGIGKEYKQ